MTGTNEELSNQYVVIFITDLEFAITLVFKKPIAILTSTSTIDINVPTSETRICFFNETKRFYCFTCSQIFIAKTMFGNSDVSY